MRRATLAVCLAVLPSCLGSQGPSLPENVGMSHRDNGNGAEDQAPAEPMEVGTAVWSDFRGTGFFLQGVVAERRDVVREHEHDPQAGGCDKTARFSEAAGRADEGLAVTRP